MSLPETATVKMNDGSVVTRPLREARSLVSRRLADWHATVDDDAPVEVPLDAPTGTPAQEDRAAVVADYVEAYDRATLVQLAEDNGLATSGNKTELVERLLDAHVKLSTAPVAGATPEDVPVETEESSTVEQS